MRLLALLTALVFSPVTPAIQSGEFKLTVDEERFYFDLTLIDVPESAGTTSLRIFTRTFPFIIPPSNEEQFLLDFRTVDGVIIDGPRVEPIGVPTRDRWQDGVVADFTLSELSQGTWRFTGSIVHGADPFLPCDRMGGARFTYSGGALVWGSNLVESVPFAAISLTKYSTTQSIHAAGQVVDYRYVIRNTGDLLLHNVALADQNVDQAPVCAFSGAPELAPRGQPGSTVVCTAQRTVTADEIAGEGTLDNTATATADEATAAYATLSIPVGLHSDGFESPPNRISLIDDSACDVGWYSSLAIGNDGYPVISYLNRTRHSLKVAKCNDVACYGWDEALNTLDESAPGETYLAVGADGMPVIAYQQDIMSPEKALYVAKCSDGACANGNVTLSVIEDSANSVGRFGSIAIGQDGFPVVSYHDETAGTLKVAKCNDPACSGGDESISTVDDAPGVSGQWTSLAIGTDGYPVIAYGQHDPALLKVAKCNDAACAGGDENISAVDDTLEYGAQDTSLAIGTDGFPVISYHDLFNRALRVAKCNDAACSGGDETISVVDENSVGDSSIAIGNDGLPVIAYLDDLPYGLKVAKCNDAACSGQDELRTIVDSTPSGSISIAIGSDGLPVISYRDGALNALKVLHCSTPSCASR